MVKLAATLELQRDFMLNATQIVSIRAMKFLSELILHILKEGFLENVAAVDGQLDDDIVLRE